MGKYKYTLWEYGSDAKASSVDVHAADLNVGNIAVQVGLAGDLKDAVDDVVLGNPGSEDIVAVTTERAKNPSSSTGAQRELKWLVSFVDTTTNFGGSFTIPTANPARLGTDGTFMNLAGTEGAALVDAIEAYVLSRAGNAITVTSVKLVGRSI